MYGVKNNVAVFTVLAAILFSGCTALPPAPPQPIVNSLPPASEGALSELAE